MNGVQKKLTKVESKKKYNYYYNQLHTPRQLNEQVKHKMFFKSGNSTMLICKNITGLAGTSLELYITKFLKKHGTKLEGTFIFTQ